MTEGVLKFQVWPTQHLVSSATFFAIKFSLKIGFLGKYNFLFVLLSLLTFSGFTQPVGGDIVLNISNNSESVVFKSSNKNENSTLKSVSGDFVLKDLSTHYAGLNNYVYQKYPTKTIFTTGSYHLQLKNKSTNQLMDIYLYNVIECNYYLEIDFTPGIYLLTIVAHNQVKNGCTKLEHTYHKKQSGKQVLGYNITPVNWSMYQLANSDLLSTLNSMDYMLNKAETEPKDSLPKKATYMSLNTNPQAKLVINADRAILTTFYNTIDKETHYYEWYGKIESQKDSTYYFVIDSIFYAEAFTYEELIEGREPATRILNEGLLEVGNGLHRSSFKPMFNLAYANDSLSSQLNLSKYKFTELPEFRQYDLTSDIPKWLQKDSIKRGVFLQYNRLNNITNANIKLPIAPYFKYRIGLTNSTLSRTLIWEPNGMSILEDRIKLVEVLKNK